MPLRNRRRAPRAAEVLSGRLDSRTWLAEEALDPRVIDAHVHYSQTGWADGRSDYFIWGKQRQPGAYSGASLGGPVVQNKAFFFADVEAFRQTRENVAFQSIPTLQQRQGILTVPVRNPVTGEVFPAGTPIPMTAFARKVLSELPEPTSSGTSSTPVPICTFCRPRTRWSSESPPSKAASRWAGWRGLTAPPAAQARSSSVR